MEENKPNDVNETNQANISDTEAKPTDINMIREKHKARKRGRTIKKTAFICVFVALIAIIIFTFSIYKDMTKLSLTESVYITLSGDETLSDVAEILDENGVIKHKLAFCIVAKIKNLDGDFGAGRYKIEPDSKYTYVLRMLKQTVDEQSITIIEGSTQNDIFDAVSKSGYITEEELREASWAEYDYWFLDGIDRENRLEGYLYPDTYIFSPTQSGRDMINKLLEQFDAVFSKKYKKRAEELDMSVDEIVILASIIQAEAPNSEDMKKVSAVFHKRLKKNDRLQSCASVLYALGEKKDILSTEDIKIESPYNTYKYSGLTPGPICSPGNDAIYAALYPADCTYYYFQSDKDGNMYFSDTFEEHEKIRKEIQKEQD